MGYGPAAILYNAAGTSIATLTANPAGTELALVVRNIPSGTQNTTNTAQLPAALGQTTMANSLAVTWASDQTPVPDITASGNLTAPGQTVTISATGRDSIKVVVSGTWTGTLMFEQSVDGVVFTPQAMVPLPPTLGLPQSTTTTINGAFVGNASATASFRVRSIALSSGTAAVFVRTSTMGHSLAFNNLLDDGIILTDNSTTTPLGIGGVFTGGTHDVSSFTSITIFSYSDQAGTLQVEWSTDGTNWDSIVSYSIAVGQHDHLTFSRRARYFRLIWTNGAVGQATFRLQTIGQKVAVLQNIVGVNEALDDNASAQLSRAVITGKSVATSNAYVNATVLDHDGLGTFNTPALAVRQIRDRYDVTAFGELRVSNPFTLTDIINKYGRDSRLISTSVAGGGTVTNLYSMSGFALAVGATNGDAALARTNEYYRYQSNRGQQIMLSVIHSDVGHANQTRNWGNYDNDDGLMFRLSGTTVQVVRRTSTGEGGGTIGSPFESVVSQASWNVDTLNGSGPSGITLDITKGHIFEIRYQWLGVGNIFWFIDSHLVHISALAGVLAYPFMRTATLPLTWEVINTGASSAGTMNAICGHVTSESGEEPPSLSFATQGSKQTSSAAEFPVVSIRLASTLSTVDNRISVVPTLLDLAETNNGDVWIFMRLNPTLTGPAWGAVDSRSGVEVDTTASATTGGQLIARFSLPALGVKTLDIDKFFKLGSKVIRRDSYTGTSDIFSISIQRITGANPLVGACLAWNEYQ